MKLASLTLALALVAVSPVAAEEATIAPETTPTQVQPLAPVTPIAATEQTQPATQAAEETLVTPTADESAAQ